MKVCKRKFPEAVVDIPSPSIRQLLQKVFCLHSLSFHLKLEKLPENLKQHTYSRSLNHKETKTMAT